VIINSRTGTVVISSSVRLKPAAVSHGSLTVTIVEEQQVSQPGAFSRGTTAVVPQSTVKVEQGDSRMFVFNPGVSLNEIVQAVNQVGAAPGDLVAILEALKQRVLNCGTDCDLRKAKEKRTQMNANKRQCFLMYA